MKKKEFALTNYYHDLIYNIQEIKSIKEFDKISLLLKTDLETQNFLTLNHLFIFKLSNNYFSKALILKKKFKVENLPCSFNDIFSLLKKHDFVSPLYNTFFQKNEMKNIFKTKKKIKKKKDILKIFKNNLKNIFDLQKIDDYKIGYSIIDLNGNFLWCSKKSEILFENFRNKKIKNFFNLLIPFSKNLLFKKFEKTNSKDFTLFEEDSKIGKKIYFTFVIYSQIKINKFEKYLYSLNIKNFTEFQKVISNNKCEFTIFNRYLKQLRSKCKLIIIKLSKDDLLNIEFNEDEKIVFYNKNMKLIKLSRFEIFNPNGVYLKKTEFLYKKVIYLETREINSKLNFDYKLMKEDFIIKKIEEEIKLKYKKNINRKK